MYQPYTAYGFKKLSKAKAKARKMRKLYGYMPRVFKETKRSTGRVRYVVVKAKGMRRL